MSANIVVLYLLYISNSLPLIAGFFYSFRRKRIYSLLWASLTALHVLSIFNLEVFITKFTIATLFKGQLLMIPANILLLIVFVGLDQIFLKNRSIKIIPVADLKLNKRLANRYFVNISFRYYSSLDVTI